MRASENYLVNLREEIMNALHRVVRLPVLIGITFFTSNTKGADSINEEVAVATLLNSTPLIIQIPEAPRDPGHSFSPELLERLSSRAKTTPSGSATEGVAGHVLFGPPTRQGITNSNPGYISISNFVDQDPAAPDMVLDYECGDRTYDLDDGSNHNGIDYFNFPFGWLTMQQDGSIVIAAADGEIIEKHDGEPDMNCAFSESAAANQIVVEHSDGSVAIYAHLKQGTTTAKSVGDTVRKGDYIGVVGSSGFSNGPHLHFGVYDSGNNLIEPFEGACNTLNDDSWWEDQEDYYQPGLNLIATHTEVPEFPPCPGVEDPHFEDSFSPGDTVFVSAFFRDALIGEMANMEVLGPSGTQPIPWTFEYDAEHAAGLMVVWAIEFTSNAPSGAYTYRATYGGVAREHTFYINSGPNPPPAAVVANNAQNGLFFDPGKDGEGYNFVTAGAGTVIYFYGSDKFGNRLWLISDLIPGRFGPGATIEVTMFESTGGTFGSPVPSARGLSVWGTLVIVFSDCDNAVATLTGVDGVKVSQLIKLAGVAGTVCTEGGATPDSPWSGLWFALADEGEGYNLIVAPNGAILYFYGFKVDGRRLWLISDLIVDELQIGVGVVAPMFEANQGDFDNPVPSAQALVQWGTATITLIDCSHITIELAGSDGSKTSVTVRLAGIIGLDCSD